MLNLAGDYAAWWQASEQLLRGLAPQREAVFGLNAMQCYRLVAPPAR